MNIQEARDKVNFVESCSSNFHIIDLCRVIKFLLDDLECSIDRKAIFKPQVFLNDKVVDEQIERRRSGNAGDLE